MCVIICVLKSWTFSAKKASNKTFSCWLDRKQTAAVSSYTHVLSHQHSSGFKQQSHPTNQPFSYMTVYLLSFSCVLIEAAARLNTHIVLSQVGFLFPSQDLQSCGLANTVGPHQPQDLTRPGDRQPAHTQTHTLLNITAKL